MNHWTPHHAESAARSLLTDAEALRDMPPTYMREAAPNLRKARDAINEALNEDDHGTGTED